MKRLQLILIAAFAAPAVVWGQTAPLWRSVDISRQLRDTLPQRVRVQYGVGRVDVRGTNDPLLYSIEGSEVALRADTARQICIASRRPHPNGHKGPTPSNSGPNSGPNSSPNSSEDRERP